MSDMTSQEALDWQKTQNKRISELEAECNDLAHQLNQCNERGGRILADAERWRKHGPILIGIIEELVDEANDLGWLGHGAQLRINEALDAARGSEEVRVSGVPYKVKRSDIRGPSR
jgi:hypothetical protein